LKSVYSAALWRRRSVESENVEIERTAKGSRYPLYRREGKDTYTILICREVERLRERNLNYKWLNINVERAYEKLINCNKANRTRNTGKFFIQDKMYEKKSEV